MVGVGEKKNLGGASSGRWEWIFQGGGWRNFNMKICFVVKLCEHDLISPLVYMYFLNWEWGDNHTRVTHAPIHASEIGIDAQKYKIQKY